MHNTHARPALVQAAPRPEEAIRMTSKRNPKDDGRDGTVPRPELNPSGGVATPENTGGGEKDGGKDGGGEKDGGGREADPESGTVRMFSPAGSPAAPLTAPKLNPPRPPHQITSPAVSAVMGEEHRRIVDDAGNEVTDLSTVLVKDTEKGSARHSTARLWSESSVPGAPGAAPRRRLLFGKDAPVDQHEYDRLTDALDKAVASAAEAAASVPPPTANPGGVAPE